MAALRDLHSGLMKLSASGGGARLYFYVAAPSGALRHGYFLVLNDLDCQLVFEDKSPDEALALLPTLQYVKVDTLQSRNALAPDPTRPVLDIRHVLNVIDPDLRAQAERQPAPAPAAPMPAPRVTNAPLQPAPAPVAASGADPMLEAARIGLANVRLREQAAQVLGELLGNGAVKKVEAIAARHPPVQKPVEFLRECESLAAMIVGKQRAAELFAPLHLQVQS